MLFRSSALSILRPLDDLWSLVSIASATVHFNSACSLMGWLHFHRCYHHTLTVIIICLNCAVMTLCCQPALLHWNVQCWWTVQLSEIKPRNSFLKIVLNGALFCRDWLFLRPDEMKHDGKKSDQQSGKWTDDCKLNKFPLTRWTVLMDHSILLIHCYCKGK